MSPLRRPSGFYRVSAFSHTSTPGGPTRIPIPIDHPQALIRTLESEVLFTQVDVEDNSSSTVP